MACDSRLEQAILAALKQAVLEGRQDVADDLLSALEALCTDSEPTGALAEAYLLITDWRAS